MVEGEGGPVLRSYQEAAVDAVDAAIADGQRPLLVLPTGSGKTVIAAALIRRWVGREERVLFLAPRRELVMQTCEKLAAVGVSFGVLLAGAASADGLAAPVQVASIDTLVARCVKRRSLVLDPFDLAIMDEAHLSITKVRVELLQQLTQGLCGLTATPTRKDGRALRVLYDVLIEPATVDGLTAAGHLVPARYWSWPPDLEGVRVIAGDYQTADLEAAVNQTPLLGDLVAHWQRHAAGRRTVVFATTIPHAVAIAQMFQEAGIAAEHVDAGTPPGKRLAIFTRFRAGETQVLTNCFLAAYGFDLPVLSCVVLARPTRSLMLYLQMLGRGLRPAPGKTDCVVLDHAGCVGEHGFAADPRAWQLTGLMALEPAAQRKAKEKKPHTCPTCHAVWTDGAVCPECGTVLQVPAKDPPMRPGELVEWASNAGEWTHAARVQFFAELRAVGAQRGYKRGWAAAQYRERFGGWPPWSWNDSAMQRPSAATWSWVQSRLIAYAKAQQKATRIGHPVTP